MTTNTRAGYLRRRGAAGVGTALLLLALAVSPYVAFADDDDEGGTQKNRNRESAMTVSAGLLARISNVQQQFEALRQSVRAAFAAENLELPRGIERRLEQGKPLPPGWEKKLKKKNGQGNATTTPPTGDVTPPRLLEHAVTADTGTARVTWKTDEQSWGRVRFSKANALNETNDAVDSSFGERHAAALENLSPNTDYRFRIVSADAKGNTGESELFAFRTAATSTTITPPADTTAPQIITVFPRSVASTSARIIWVTNEPSDSRLHIGTSSPVATAGAPTASSCTLSFYHELEAAGLASSTDYVYAVVSRDAAGNTAVQNGNTFRTVAE